MLGTGQTVSQQMTFKQVRNLIYCKVAWMYVPMSRRQVDQKSFGIHEWVEVK